MSRLPGDHAAPGHAFTLAELRTNAWIGGPPPPRRRGPANAGLRRLLGERGYAMVVAAHRACGLLGEPADVNVVPARRR